MSEPIHVAAVVLRDPQGRVLTVRKRGTTRFMFPGGKPEPGEEIRETAVRETVEELGVTLDPQRLNHLGTWTTAAANEEGRQVSATVFTHPPVAVAQPRAEIEALRWIDPADRSDDLAPLLREAVLPALLTPTRAPDAPA